MGSLPHDAQGMTRSLRGQTIHVPDLREILKNWPVQSSIHYERLSPVVRGAFDRMVNNSTLRQKYHKANYARFVSLYYPHPDWNQIKTLSLFITWLFCWDDALDQQSVSSLSSDLSKAKAYRNNTIQVTKEAIGLLPGGSGVKCDNVNAELKLVGCELQKAYSLEQRQIFMAQMQHYIENCDKEQSLRLQGTLPDMGSYREIRDGTAGVWLLCALIEFGLSENLPENVRYMDEIQTIWAETSRAIWITNDILSLKKEIPRDDSAAESIVSAVPILMAEEGKSPQQAVDALIAELSVSFASFEAAACVLAEAAGEGGRQMVQKYCDASRCMVTGSIQFTYESTRYQLAGCLNDDGSLDITL
ncbi:hypothetical protein CSOJ01_03732 [Colletotrichum sojae]|uniref:Terpene synthase n=1 Tax=Colletotrichum sojae TaxID=2175907 RepID=A0A8H6JLA1_9PEZI|nr:hypothetical protein CSOJ01_03732 [Colletotrichum sojae]